MKYFAFIARHDPTPEQHDMAAAHGIQLVPIGDRDAFTVCRGTVKLAELEARRGKVLMQDEFFEGVVVVHAAAAMRLCRDYPVGVFENENRAAVGEKPTFTAKALHVYDVRPD